MTETANMTNTLPKISAPEKDVDDEAESLVVDSFVISYPST
jgi:hypothetical protein